jgi:Uma2 family endonuclease
MKTAAAKKRYTPEDLLTMPDGDSYELVNGKLVELNVSMFSSYIAGIIYSLLHAYCEAKKLGWVFPVGTSFQCFPEDRRKVRKPDVSFIALHRLSVNQALVQGHGQVVPDLAVEVVSPKDLFAEVSTKVDEWLNAGVRLVWVVDPKQRTVTVYLPGTAGKVLREKDKLTGNKVIPGFRCQIGQFFRMPSGTAAR